MKRAKKGDVYCMKVFRGYKIYQWAYRIPRYGDYIRVFDGLYQEIPSTEEIEKIVASKHSYIILLDAGRVYRIGLATLLGNYPVPEEFPVPKYQFNIFAFGDETKRWTFHFLDSHGENGEMLVDPNEEMKYMIDVDSYTELPEEYQTGFIATMVPPSKIMFLFDIEFDLDHLERFFPQWYHPSGIFELALKPYTDIVNQALIAKNMKPIETTI